MYSLIQKRCARARDFIIIIIIIVTHRVDVTTGARGIGSVRYNTIIYYYYHNYIIIICV